VDRNRDRDYDGVPDWQEDENYADEAPIVGPRSPRARMRGGGCALPVGLLAAGLAVLAARATRRPPTTAGPGGTAGATTSPS
jgi:hypothetical protein